MRRIIIASVAVAGLTACTTATQAVADGQLFCARATSTGPLVVALATAAGAPLTVTNKAAADVAAACAVIGALPVAPPANPAAAPVVASSAKL
jgi:predicted ATPase